MKTSLDFKHEMGGISYESSRRGHSPLLQKLIAEVESSTYRCDSGNLVRVTFTIKRGDRGAVSLSYRVTPAD